MSNNEYQVGSSSFLLKFLLAIVVFITLYGYVVSRNADGLLVY